MRHERDALLDFDVEQVFAESPLEPAAAATNVRWLRSPLARGLMVGVTAMFGVALWHRSTVPVRVGRSHDLIGETAMAVRPPPPAPHAAGQLAAAASLPQQAGAPAGDAAASGV